MKYFTLEMRFAKLKDRTTIYCWEARTKFKNDELRGMGNTPDEAVNELFEAVAFESN